MKDEKIRVVQFLIGSNTVSFKLLFQTFKLGHVDNIRYPIFLSRNNSTFAVNALVLLVHLVELNFVKFESMLEVFYVSEHVQSLTTKLNHGINFYSLPRLTKQLEALEQNYLIISNFPSRYFLINKRENPSSKSNGNKYSSRAK